MQALHTFQAGGDLVIADAVDVDEAQITGRWIRGKSVRVRP